MPGASLDVEVISPMKRGLKSLCVGLMAQRIYVEVISPMKRGLKYRT